MKFPRTLSKERIYLLSPEDKEIYYREHPESLKKKVIIRECVEDDEVKDVSEDFEEDPLDVMLDEQLQVIERNLENSTVVDDFVNNIITEEVDNMIVEFESLFRDYANLFEDKEIELDENRWSAKKDGLNMLTEEEFVLEESDDYKSLLLEGAEGYDCGEWIKGLMPKVGWLGKWIGAGLGALGVGLGYLITIGKDRLAMAKLKKYMNRLVELTDQGVHKKRPWYSYLTWGETRKNLGEYNNGCFRSVQEAADRNMCVCVMVAAQKLGYFNVGQMMDMSSGGYPQDGGGLKAFETNVANKLNIIITHN